MKMTYKYSDKVKALTWINMPCNHNHRTTKTTKTMMIKLIFSPFKIK